VAAFAEGRPSLTDRHDCYQTDVETGQRRTTYACWRDNDAYTRTHVHCATGPSSHSRTVWESSYARCSGRPWRDSEYTSRTDRFSNVRIISVAGPGDGGVRSVTKKKKNYNVYGDRIRKMDFASWSRGYVQGEKTRRFFGLFARETTFENRVAFCDKSRGTDCF